MSKEDTMNQNKKAAVEIAIFVGLKPTVLALLRSAARGSLARATTSAS